MEDAFAITLRKGFRMTFENGWTVSVQFGPGNYCEHHFAHWGEPDRRSGWESKTAEIAAWDENATWYKFPSGDTVDGWKTPDEVAAFIGMVAAFKRKTA